VSELQRLLGAAVIGIGGAAVIAVLVLGRGGQAGATPMDLSALDDGGVMVMRMEVYERHGAKAELIAQNIADGNLSLFPERYVMEVWTLLGSGGEQLGQMEVAWIEGDEVLHRTRFIDGEFVIERPALGFSERQERPGFIGNSLSTLPSEMCAELRADFDRMLAGAGYKQLEPTTEDTIVIARPLSANADELAMALGPRGYWPPYYGDMDVTDIMIERTYTADYWPIRKDRWAVLSDGSRVLVESRRFTIEARPTWEWRWFEARVWGD
jgi:hypothetical protein